MCILAEAAVSVVHDCGNVSFEFFTHRRKPEGTLSISPVEGDTDMTCVVCCTYTFIRMYARLPRAIFSSENQIVHTF